MCAARLLVLALLRRYQVIPAADVSRRYWLVYLSITALLEALVLVALLLIFKMW